MTVSIMIVTYNRLELTKQTFNNLFSTIKSPFRLIIIDNSSTDGTIEYLKELQITNSFCISYHTKFNSKNYGIAVGRNLALHIADQFDDEWLATVDNDVEMPDGWLEECIDILQKNSNYMAIGVNMEDVHYPIVDLNGKKIQRKANGNLGSANAVFNREIHRQIGFFNINYNLYGEEDSDQYARMRSIFRKEIGYILPMGRHLGVGEQDTGQYREFKNQCRQGNLVKFRANCAKYMSDKKSCYISFDNPEQYI